MIEIKRLDISDARLLIAGAAQKANEIGVPMYFSRSAQGGFDRPEPPTDLGCVAQPKISDRSFAAVSVRNSALKLEVYQ